MQAYVIEGHIPDAEGGEGTRMLSKAMQELTGLGPGGEFELPNGREYHYVIDGFGAPSLWTFNDSGTDFTKIVGAIREACAHARTLQ
jgi:hypothetical protein